MENDLIELTPAWIKEENARCKLEGSINPKPETIFCNSWLNDDLRMCKESKRCINYAFMKDAIEKNES